MSEVDLAKIVQAQEGRRDYFYAWKDLCLQTSTKIVKFSPPPPHWFLEGRILGIDFEGCPPCLCQISCSEGVYINSMSDPLVHLLLKDPRHLHAVFSSGDMGRVKNGFDTQVFFSTSSSHKISLQNAFNREFDNQFWKDSSIHVRESWKKRTEQRSLTTEQVNYAASDALATRLLAYSALEKTGLLGTVLSSMRSDSRGEFQILFVQMHKSEALSSSLEKKREKKEKKEKKRPTHRGRRGNETEPNVEDMELISLT